MLVCVCVRGGGGCGRSTGCVRSTVVDNMAQELYEYSTIYH